MVVLVDTCGWIEWLTDGPLAELFRPHFADAPALLVPTCLQFELYKWAKRERGEAVALEAVALTEQAHVVPLTTAIALHAADLALQHRLSFAAALIFATASQHQAKLVTLDEHFAGLPGVVYLEKR
jgi:predicted nucleic acid-binding protein